MIGEKSESDRTSHIKRLQKLLVLCSVVFALWIAGLIAMYFITVYPQRHPTTAAAK